MTQQEYEQKKRECWEEYVNLLNHNSAARYVFDKIFDRAYALGKIDGAKEQKECSDRSMKIQKICAELKESCNKFDKAIKRFMSQSYEEAKLNYWNEAVLHGALEVDKDLLFDHAFKCGYTLGREKETISQEEIENEAVDYAFGENQKRPDARPDTMPEYTCEDLIDAFKAGANFALGKQEKDTDTVIQGWVCRAEGAIRPKLYTSKPLRQKKGFENGYWSYGMQIGLALDPSLFPDITWDSDPIECEIIIKRKKK